MGVGIGEVVAHLKQGGTAQRSGWNGKGMYLFLKRQTPATDEEGNPTMFEPCVVLRTPRGTYQPGWVCSQEDLLSQDWQLLDPDGSPISN